MEAPMDVTRWKTPATFFPWSHVQRYIDRIDPQAYSIAVALAQQFHGSRAHACPTCGRAPNALFWFSLASPEEAWDAGTGQVGFLTLCKLCKLQVDFLIDQELTDMQSEQWRDHRALY
jgi:hypothetical protein